MQSAFERGRILTVEHGWIKCPYCSSRRLLRLLPETSARNLAVYCRHCRHEVVLNIEEARAREASAQFGT